MQEQLRLLVKLQTIDKLLYELQTELDDIPALLTQLSQEQEKLESELNTAKTELEQVTSRRKELEKENDSIRSRVRRAENRLMSAKSQREYRAANAEIEEGKDALKSNDDVLLELMERQEALSGKVKELDQSYLEISSEVNKKRKQLAKRANQIETEIARLDKERSGLAGGVDPELMSQYDFIRKARQGVALAAVKDGTCLVCHMQLPPQQFNELQKLDKIMSCPSCRRLIYWADAEFLTDQC